MNGHNSFNNPVILFCLSPFTIGGDQVSAHSTHGRAELHCITKEGGCRGTRNRQTAAKGLENRKTVRKNLKTETETKHWAHNQTDKPRFQISKTGNQALKRGPICTPKIYKTPSPGAAIGVKKYNSNETNVVVDLVV